LNKKGKSLASEFKSPFFPTAKENKTSFTKEREKEREKELPIVIDTYTHKKDIPLLEKDDIDEDFQIKVGAEEEPIAMEIEKIKEENLEDDNISAKLVADFGEF